MNPKVSIIIPTFNRAHLIVETLDSIVAQTYTNWECIVVDDGSSDNTAEVLAQYIQNDKRFQYHQRPIESQKGVGVCRNYGFQISKGEFINFVDSDDILTPSHIEFHLNVFDKNNIECSVTNSKIFYDQKEKLVGNWSNINTNGDLIFDMIKTDVLWAIGAVVWKKSAFKNDIPFIVELTNSEEWTFHILQIVDGKKYQTSNETTYLARRHSDRVGENNDIQKFHSTFKSRVYILDYLKSVNENSKKRELFLLKGVFGALLSCIKNNYFGLTSKIMRYLFLGLFCFKNKYVICKILFISFPMLFVFKRGEKLFKV